MSRVWNRILVLVDIKKSLIFTLGQATNTIVDVELHSEDVLQELKSKIVNLKLVESDNEYFICQILQNSIENSNIEVCF